MELAEVQALYGMIGPVFAEHGRAFFLADLRQSGLPPEPVRKWIAEWLRSHRELSGGAAFGAGLVTRSLFLLMGRALALIGKSQPQSRVFATEAEARAWLDTLRRQLMHISS